MEVKLNKFLCKTKKVKLEVVILSQSNLPLRSLLKLCFHQNSRILDILKNAVWCQFSPYIEHTLRLKIWAIEKKINNHLLLTLWGVASWHHCSMHKGDLSSKKKCPSGCPCAGFECPADEKSILILSSFKSSVPALLMPNGRLNPIQFDSDRLKSE